MKVGELRKLEREVSKILHKRRKTLALAESCTGGLIAKRLTDFKGASEILWGGVVAYTPSAKKELLGVPHEHMEIHGAVSEVAATAMAKGVLSLSGADYGLAVTGYCGGDRAGLVFVALAVKNGGSYVKQVDVGPTRDRGRILAASYALELLLNELIK